MANNGERNAEDLADRWRRTKMPGGTVGTHLDPPNEVLWDGRITILKIGSGYDVQYQYETGDATVGTMIRICRRS